MRGFKSIAGAAVVIISLTIGASPAIASCSADMPSGVYCEGVIQLSRTQLVDFDTGTTTVSGGPSLPGADLWYVTDSATVMALAPMNGAQIAVGNLSERGSLCRSASFTTNSWKYTPDAWRVGSYVCFKTNERRIGQFRIDKVVFYNDGGPGALTLSFTTYISQ